MRAVERFCRYAAYDTQSSEVSGTSPSTEKQLVLAKALCEELTALGAENAHVDEYGYVYGWVPAAPGCEAAPALGLIAHMDTAPAFSGTGVTPVFHEHYDGGDVPLPKAGRTIRVKDFLQMKTLRGRTLITADGSTLLGADDKAGIAEIMTLLETLAATGAPHGRLCIAFTPDEEIGQGADHFDVQKFGAKYAYTMDGGAEGGVEYENFNAAAARFDITGVSVHPGSAKGVMGKRPAHCHGGKRPAARAGRARQNRGLPGLFPCDGPFGHGREGVCRIHWCATTTPKSLRAAVRFCSRFATGCRPSTPRRASA